MSADKSRTEYGLVVLKPDALVRELEDEVYERLNNEGLTIHCTTREKPSQEEVHQQYKHVPEGLENGEEILDGIKRYLAEEEMKAAIVSREFDHNGSGFNQYNLGIYLKNIIGDHPHPEGNDKDTIRGQIWKDPESDFYAEGGEREQYSVESAREGEKIEEVRNLVHFADDVDELKRDTEIYFDGLDQLSEKESLQEIFSEIESFVETV